MSSSVHPHSIMGDTVHMYSGWQQTVLAICPCSRVHCLPLPRVLRSVMHGERSEPPQRQGLLALRRDKLEEDTSDLVEQLKATSPSDSDPQVQPLQDLPVKEDEDKDATADDYPSYIHANY